MSDKRPAPVKPSGWLSNLQSAGSTMAKQAYDQGQLARQKLLAAQAIVTERTAAATGASIVRLIVLDDLEYLMET